MSGEAPDVIIHGAGRTVTGSCFEVRSEDSRLLVDCGLFQGSRTLEALNYQPFAFDPEAIDSVILTHAHIDHSGLLPRLVAEGFRGRIHCTAPTADLLQWMLPDAARIQEQDADRRNRRADRAADPPRLPLYRLHDARTTLGRLRAEAPGHAFTPVKGVSARLWNAGHILGSASVEILAGGSRILFSGDIGPEHKAFLPDPEGPSGVDHLFCEATYGDRERPDQSLADRRTLLETELKAALARGGNVLIPAFALERTQELLLDIALLVNQGRLPHTRVFIDSPLANGITAVFAARARHLMDVPDVDLFQHPVFHYVSDRRTSQRIGRLKGVIIIAASGMCEAGRIRAHLVDNLPDPGATVLFVGFQAQGTLGRVLKDGASRVRISGSDVVVRAQMKAIEGYSAHADRSELLSWIAARQPVHGSIFLTHGEPAAIESLVAALAPADVHAPTIGQRFRLPAAARAIALPPVRDVGTGALGSDWQNDYAKLAVELKPGLQRLPDDRARERAIRAMRAALEQALAQGPQ
ncbi:MBL fold metallo-hydrolase [Thermaurantiacus sp.]